MPHNQDPPWPEAYDELLPLISDQWKVEGEIYFRQQLGAGKSGALVYIVDVTCDGFSGLAILKLDILPALEWQEMPESERHRSAIAASPEYGARHLPRIVHTVEHNGRIAILSTVVARGLEYSVPWIESGYGSGLDVIQRLSKGLLEDWNDDYQMAAGMHMPQDLLKSWLGYRLDPEAGRLHQFLTDRCNLSPQEPTFSFEGHWFPNPVAFACGAVDLPSRLHLRAAEGRLHGDLHGYNVLVRAQEQEESDYYLIDLALYEDRQYLFYDHAYFEISFLLARREFAQAAQWEAMLDHLSLFHHNSHSMGLWQDDIGLMEFVGVMRREAMNWISRHESQRLSFLESQYLLARVAAGLNFANKDLSDGLRTRALLYAAHNLKDYLILNNIDWPKHGTAFYFSELEKSTPLSEGAEITTVPTTEPPAEKNRHFERMVAQMPVPQKPVIAVIPFESLSSQAEHEHIVDGITHEVVTELSKVDWLAVVSRSSTKAFKDNQISSEETAQRLGAHYLVEGSARLTKDDIRVTAHLVDTANGHYLWADRFERKIDDVFDLQDEIAEAVVGHIDWELKFDVRERARLKRGEISLWDRVQKSLWHLGKFTKEDTQAAKDIIAKTVDLTPDYALAHAAMAMVDLRKLSFAEVEDRDAARKRALTHAERAVVLDEQNSFARAILARVYSRMKQHDRAITEAEIAIGLNPSSATSYLVLGTSLMAKDLLEEALPQIETAIRLSPSGPYFKIKILAKGFCLYLLDDLEKAEACVQPALEGRSVGPFGWLNLAAILVRQGRLDEAHKAVQKALDIRPDVNITTYEKVVEHFSKEHVDRVLGDLKAAGLS